MASLEYLMTVLPDLPASLGEKASIEEAYRIIKAEDNARLNYLIDIISAEDEIVKCGLQYFVLQNKNYEAELPASLPEAFTNAFYSFSSKSEADWMTAVYGAWFDMLVDTGKKTGSQLVQEWAKWEYSLRINLMFDRLKRAGIEYDEASLTPEFMAFDCDCDTASLVEAYRKINEPMKAEKSLDEARLDFIRSSAISYSFTADELVAYILELRIYARYARLSPEQGRKILQEVTAL